MKIFYIIAIIIVLSPIGWLIKNKIELTNYRNNSKPYVIYVSIPDASKLQKTLWDIEYSNAGNTPKILERNGNIYKIEVKCPPDRIEKLKKLFP